MKTATVHIIDDDIHLCTALHRLLTSYGYDVRVYLSAKLFLSEVIPSGPACVVLDLSMPEMSGLDVQEVLSQRSINLPIIFMSGLAEVRSSVRAMKAGALDFITKPFDEDELLLAVQSALIVCVQALAREEDIQRDRDLFINLTPREQEVCLGVARGLLNKQVAYQLGTTEKTVKAQRARVMQKLGADSLSDVVKLIERLQASGGVPATSAHPPTRPINSYHPSTSVSSDGRSHTSTDRLVPPIVVSC
jgi:FixJ family two-component response regulator